MVYLFFLIYHKVFKLNSNGFNKQQVCCPSDKVASTNFKDGTKYCKTEAEINAYNEDYYEYDNNEDGIIEEKPDCKPPPDDRYLTETYKFHSSK